jgi:hypothetical protein
MKCSARQGLAIGAAATLVHLAVFLTACRVFHVSVDAYSDKGDGASYKQVAARILGERATLDEYDSRVFPGYPLLIALVHEITRLPLGVSALAITFVSAGVAAMLAGIYFDDVRVALAVAFLLPHAWINLSLAMSEGPVLAMEMLGIWVARRSAVGSGIVFALAVLIRPVAGVALMAALFERAARKRFREGLVMTGTAVALALVVLLALTPITGGPVHSLRVYANSPRAYAGRMLTWPFHSIVWMTLHGHVGIGHWIYVMMHVALCVGGCFVLVRRNSAIDLLAFVWLFLNTLLVLCLGLGPGGWGFNHFPRFTLPALPALAWSWRRLLPGSGWVYIAVCAGLFVVGVLGVRGTP